MDNLGFPQLLDKEVVLIRIVPCVRDLSQNTFQHIRAALANQISGLVPLVSKDSTTEHLLLVLHLKRSTAVCLDRYARHKMN